MYPVELRCIVTCCRRTDEIKIVFYDNATKRHNFDLISGILVKQRLEIGVENKKKSGISNRISISIAYILYINVL